MANSAHGKHSNAVVDIDVRIETSTVWNAWLPTNLETSLYCLPRRSLLSSGIFEVCLRLHASKQNVYEGRGGRLCNHLLPSRCSFEVRQVEISRNR